MGASWEQQVLEISLMAFCKSQKNKTDHRLR
jgi:hypothetical protein